MTISEFMKIVEENNQQKLVDCLNSGKINAHRYLLLAAHFNEFEMVKTILPYCDNTQEAFERASESYQWDIVKLLLPTSDAKGGHSLALRRAAENGNIEMVSMLIPLSNVEDYEWGALCVAAENEHNAVVKLLIPHSDLSAQNYACLRYALMFENEELADIVYPLINIEQALETLKSGLYKGGDVIAKIEQKLKSEQEKRTISDAMPHCCVSAKNKKM